MASDLNHVILGVMTRVKLAGKGEDDSAGFLAELKVGAVLVLVGENHRVAVGMNILQSEILEVAQFPSFGTKMKT